MIIFILGLPGSGKTEYAKTLVNDGYILIDDYIDQVLDNNKNYVITSADAVFTKKENIIKLFNSFDIEFVAFENDVQACWENVIRRGDNRISYNHLLKWSDNYDVDQYDNRRPVWSIS